MHADAVGLIPAVRRCRQIRLAIGGRRHHFDLEAGALQSLAETEDRGRWTTVGDRRRKYGDVKDAWSDLEVSGLLKEQFAFNLLTP
jgi:hypothetical protein